MQLTSDNQPLTIWTFKHIIKGFEDKAIEIQRALSVCKKISSTMNEFFIILMPDNLVYKGGMFDVLIQRLPFIDTCNALTIGYNAA